MKRVASTRWMVASVMVGFALATGGCAATGGEDLDPAGTLGEGAWSEGAPPAGALAESSDQEDPGLSAQTEALSSGPRFELPFPCGQVWAGQTRSDHSPRNAVDFNRADDLGDRVVAAAAGTVSRVDNEGSDSYGRWIEIDHGSGYRTRYAHLLTQAVRTGQRVSAGQAIGTLGSTGGSSGPHLHYELLRNGVSVRPVFHGAAALFYGTRNYTSQNSCGDGGGGGGGGGGGTTTAAVGRVNTRGIALTVRSGPGTGYGAVGSVADGATVRISCQVRGASVTGTYGTSSLWDRIGTGYIADAYVSTGSDGQVAPTCR